MLFLADTFLLFTITCAWRSIFLLGAYCSARTWTIHPKDYAHDWCALPARSFWNDRTCGLLPCAWRSYVPNLPDPIPILFYPIVKLYQLSVNTIYIFLEFVNFPTVGFPYFCFLATFYSKYRINGPMNISPQNDKAMCGFCILMYDIFYIRYTKFYCCYT